MREAPQPPCSPPRPGRPRRTPRNGRCRPGCGVRDRSEGPRRRSTGGSPEAPIPYRDLVRDERRPTKLEGNEKVAALKGTHLVLGSLSATVPKIRPVRATIRRNALPLRLVWSLQLKGVAIVGLGGYAAQHHAAFERLEAAGLCQVVATCDPVLDSARVPTYRSLDEMLGRHANELDVVTLPVPVPLHAPMHRQVVDMGLACYLEKPPTLWWPEYEAMMAVESRAVRPTQVGFNFIGDPFRQGIKARIDAGEFGKLKDASLLAVWPRDDKYYARASWAGRKTLSGKPVLDNPLGNAMAHHVQNLLFLSGANEIVEVRARLLRAHPIESFDTAFVSAQLPSGVELRFAATHADSGAHFERETLTFENAKVVFTAWNRAEIHRDGNVEHLVSEIPNHGAMLEHNLAAYLDGIAPTPLSACGPFVSLIDLAFLSSGGVQPIAPSRITQRDGKVSVDGLFDDLNAFAEDGIWPAAPGPSVTPEALFTLQPDRLLADWT
ncbi:Gfo/Idh/MocA family oxidoreductase [bacterium]|nr:MAG: Gfo/Idh/MocA family oxidoreductase [bacterium]